MIDCHRLITPGFINVSLGSGSAQLEFMLSGVTGVATVLKCLLKTHVLHCIVPRHSKAFWFNVNWLLMVKINSVPRDGNKRYPSWKHGPTTGGIYLQCTNLVPRAFPFFVAFPDRFERFENYLNLVRALVIMYACSAIHLGPMPRFVFRLFKFIRICVDDENIGNDTKTIVWTENISSLFRAKTPF